MSQPQNPQPENSNPSTTVKAQPAQPQVTTPAASGEPAPIANPTADSAATLDSTLATDANAAPTVAVTNNPQKIDKIEKADMGLNEKFINVLYKKNTKIDENAFTIFNGKDKIKISILLVSKFLYAQDDSVELVFEEGGDKERNAIELLYPKEVEQLMLEDSLDEIGMRGSFILKCEGSRYQALLEKYHQFDLIIGFTLLNADNDKIYLEPYVCNITTIKQISDISDKNKKFLISFVDVLSYTAFNHNFASVRKLAQGALEGAQNYETLFNTVYDYLVSFLQRLTLGKMTFKKVNFLENSDVDTSGLVKMTLDRIPQNASVYDALKIISYDACTSIKVSEEMATQISEEFELFEDDQSVLVPLFFKDEYVWLSTPYAGVFAQEGDNLKNNVEEFKNMSKNGVNMINRALFKRNMYMPFYLAFYENKCIYESLNPHMDIDEEKLTEEESEYKCILNRYINPVSSLNIKFPDMLYNNKRWKNMIFLYEDQDKGDGNFLLKFDWIFNFYNYVFLNSGKNPGQTRFCNIIPDFYINEKIGLANGSIEESKDEQPASEGDQSQDNTDNNNSGNNAASQGEEESTENVVKLTDKDFHEFNSNVVCIKSDTSTVEAQYHIGKMITSFVMLNTAYNFNVEGSLFRRPNEIIKFNKKIDGDSLANTDADSATLTSNPLSKYTMMYITNVKHVFNGTSFTNAISANKIYDTFK